MCFNAWMFMFAQPLVVEVKPEPMFEGGACGAAATAWMFPWERRQMEGRGPLRTWEKVYWGVFVTAMALFLFSRLTDKTPAAKKVLFLPQHASLGLHAPFKANGAYGKICYNRSVIWPTFSKLDGIIVLWVGWAKLL